jgi:hypothetical protein
MTDAEKHALSLEQCALFVDSEPLRKSMTDAAAYLRASDGARVGAENERLREAVATYLAVRDAGPRHDCWDTETGEEEPGAQRFASDWAWDDYHERVATALAEVRACVGADVRTDEAQAKEPA